MLKTKKILVHVATVPLMMYSFFEGQLKFMVENNIEVHIVTSKDNFYKKMKDRYPFAFFHHVDFERKISPFKDIISILQLFKVFRKINPDLIHLHTPKASLLGAIVARLSSKSFIINHIHGIYKFNSKMIKHGFFEKITSYFSNSVLCVSKSQYKECLRLNIANKNKMSIIHNGTINGVDFENKFNPTTKKNMPKELEHKLKNNTDFIIGFMARINIDKGIYDLMNAWNNYWKNEKTKLIIVGSIELNKKDEKIFFDFVNSNNKVYYFNHTEYQECFYKCFDVLVLPSYREGFGTVLAEASAMTTPVVCYDIVGCRDAVEHNVTGFLVPLKSIKDLAKAVEIYIYNRELAIKHGLNGRERISKLFCRNDIWKKTLEYYEKSIEV